MVIEFEQYFLQARFGDPRRNFASIEVPVNVRTCPLLGWQTRLTATRIKGTSLREDEWPDITAAIAESRTDCPFCPDVLAERACTLDESRFGVRRMLRGEAFLFPNLTPYGPYSAVTVIGREHYTEVRAYDPQQYADAFLASRDYLQKVLEIDPSVRTIAITQNHLPASGGTIVHPHLQVQAEANGPAFPEKLRASLSAARGKYGRSFWPLLMETEKARGERYVGATGDWDWLTFWAPQGMMEVWGATTLPSTIAAFDGKTVHDLVDGLLRVQRWYRRRQRNSFNLAVYFFEPAQEGVTLCCRIMARNNWAPFARSDRSFYEVVLGEQVLDQTPEAWAGELRADWNR